MNLFLSFNDCKNHELSEDSDNNMKIIKGLLLIKFESSLLPLKKKKKKKKIDKIKYFSNVLKSVFDIKDFKLIKENFFTMLRASDETFNCK